MSKEEIERLDDRGMGAWDGHDADAFADIFADGGAVNDVASPEPITGRDAIRAYAQAWFTAFPDMSTRTKNRVVSEDQVATEVEFTGTNSGPMQMASGAPAMPATGKRVTGQGVYFLRVRNGKVVEVHSYPNVAGLMMQLGLIPPPPGG